MASIPVSSFNTLLDLAVSHFSQPRKKKRGFMVLGAPGGGKTALGYAVADRMGFEPHEVALMRPSLKTPVDYLGVPDIVEAPSGDGKMSVFQPPKDIHDLTTGKIKMLIIDELPDAVQSVQNVLCGLVYDYEVADLKIHEDLCIFITGNRVEDKSGAGRVITKFANRVSQHELAKSVNDWVDHALQQGWDTDSVAFVHWKGEPALYGEEGFDPNSPINASPRQWEEVCFIDKNLSNSHFLTQVKSYIPQGIAEEFMAFRRTIADLPPIDEVLKNPTTAPVVDKIDVNYALTSRLIAEVKDVKSFRTIMQYVTRLRVEMQTLFISAVVRRVSDVLSTPEYVQWCTKNQAYYGGAQ